MEVKFIAFWGGGWANSNPCDTPEGAGAKVPKGESYTIEMYPDGVGLDLNYRLPDKQPIRIPMKGKKENK